MQVNKPSQDNINPHPGRSAEIKKLELQWLKKNRQVVAALPVDNTADSINNNDEQKKLSE